MKQMRLLTEITELTKTKNLILNNHNYFIYFGYLLIFVNF